MDLANLGFWECFHLKCKRQHFSSHKPIKKDKRLIGKTVIIQLAWNYPHNGKTGVIKGFGGNWKDDPQGGRKIPLIEVQVEGEDLFFSGEYLKVVS